MRDREREREALAVGLGSGARAVCIELVAMTQAVAPDRSSFQTMHDSMRFTCDTPHFYNYSLPGTECFTDLSVAVSASLPPHSGPSSDFACAQCKIMVQSIGDIVVDYMWQQWDAHYMFGMLPSVVCRMIGKC